MVLAGEHAGEDAVARFKAEAAAVARLSHPNIVQVHEVGDHRGLPFLTLEFIEGGNLAQKLQENKLGFKASADLVHQLARAVQFAHKRGILHRDLKPANILLVPAPGGGLDGDRPPAEPRASWTPKIADFGLAKPIDGISSLTPAGVRTQSGAILGTPAYMAPEQAAGKGKKVGPACDVYALGAILYECLTGRPPFQSETTLDTLMKVTTEEPVAPRTLRPRCPRDLETICLKCLRKQPEERYASAAALADDLRRYLDGEPIEARPPGKLERLGRFLRRRKELVYLAGGAAAAVVVVVLVLALSRPPKPPATQEPGPSGVAAGGDDGDRGESGIELRRRRLISQNNLKQLAISLQNVHDVNGTFPPAALTDQWGAKTLLSWRVAVLPFIEQDNLYKQFKLNERWDSENNKKLLAQMPKVFEIPGVKTPEPYTTYYQAFVGPGTAFEPQTGQHALFGSPGLRMTSFTDGTSNTILLAEAAEAVPWTKPADLVYDPKQPLPALGGPFPDGFNVAMADGNVLFVKKTVRERTLRDAITRNDGNVLPDNWWEEGAGPVLATEAPPFRGGVAGKVTYRGRPVPAGVVAFHLADGVQGTAEVADGSYRLAKVIQPGTYKVTISSGLGTPGKVLLRIPVKYENPATSGLRCEVRPGENTYDIELTD
jgi:serine/threonine protein kinase